MTQYAMCLEVSVSWLSESCTCIVYQLNTANIAITHVLRVGLLNAHCLTSSTIKLGCIAGMRI